MRFSNAFGKCSDTGHVWLLPVSEHTLSWVLIVRWWPDVERAIQFTCTVRVYSMPSFTCIRIPSMTMASSTTGAQKAGTKDVILRPPDPSSGVGCS